MPQALGMFDQNWTLFDVCDTCNDFFGKKLDLHLTRDGVEGYLRLETGQKPATGAKELRNRRMTATWKVDGPLDGARVLLGSTEEGDQILPIPPAQVAFRRPGEDWVILTERELTAEAVAKVGAGTQVEVKIIAESGHLDRVAQRLAAVGFDFVGTSALKDIAPDGHIEVQMDFNVDTTARRAAAKIVFNYAAKVLGSHVVRRPEFATIRDFIRHGTEPWQIVFVHDGSILVGPDASTSRTHTCGIGWLAEKRCLIGLVSFFNKITYGAVLLRADSDEWVNVSNRHLFDPFERTISPIPIDG
jgi:hypothetical protein